MFTCQDIAEFVDSFIDEEFDDRERAEVELHLEQCENCRHLVEYRLQMKKLVALSLQMPAPQSLRNRIFAALEDEDLSLEESSSDLISGSPITDRSSADRDAASDVMATASCTHTDKAPVTTGIAPAVSAANCTPDIAADHSIRDSKIIPLQPLTKTSTERGGFFSNFTSKQPLKVAAFVAAAAVALFVVVYVPHWTVAPATTESLSVWDESVDWHRTDIPMEVRGTPQQVANWFKGKVNFDVSPLSFGTSPDTSLIGGRLASIHNRRAALLDYNVGGNDVTVIIFDGKGVRVPTDKLQMIDNQPIAIIGGPSSKVALFHRDDLTYTITADLPSAKFEHLIQRLLSSN